jgi:hypothetical protein
MGLVTEFGPINVVSSGRDGPQVALEVEVQFSLFVLLGNGNFVVSMQ